MYPETSTDTGTRPGEKANQPAQSPGSKKARPTPPRPSLGFEPMSARNFAQFSEFITRELGIKMPPEKATMLQSRLHRRIRQIGVASLEEYQKLLFKLPESDPEWIEFINLVTTNKTDFFREPTHFDYLVQNVIPELALNSLKVWCAGCSSGEEPYTLAMTLSEVRSARPAFDFSILATDISTRVIKLASDAIYEESKVEPVPAALRQRYLLRSKDRQAGLVRIAPELRERVRFARLNFMDTDYGLKAQFQVVFFRNVMIYFSREIQCQVLKRLCASLVPGGYLFTGHSESLVGFDLPIKQATTAVYRKI